MPPGAESQAGSGAEWSASFAHASLDGMAVYDRIIARLFTPWARDLVDRLAPAPGAAALDIACGPGTVTHILAERLGPAGRVTATDISPSMLAIASAKPVTEGSAAIEWIEAPAAPLPLPDASVDVVTCQQGLQFFPDKVAALAEMRRVLRPGGRAGVAVWTQVEDQVMVHVRDAVAQAVSEEVAARFLGPFLLSGDDAAAFAVAAGFDHVEVERVTLPAVLEGGFADLAAMLPATAIAADIEALDDATRDAFINDLVRRTLPLQDGEAIRSSMTASVLSLS